MSDSKNTTRYTGIDRRAPRVLQRTGEISRVIAAQAQHESGLAIVNVVGRNLLEPFRCKIVFAPLQMVPAELLTLHKAAVNRYYDILGVRAAEQSSADIDVIAHQTDTVKEWMKASRERGLKEALSERDRPFAKKKA